MALVNYIANLRKKRRAGSSKKAKVEKVMGEFKRGALHSGSKTGPKVTSRSQAVAIGLSEQRKADKGGY